jgi:hypothetical protein
MSGKSKSVLKEYSNLKLGKDFLEFKNIILVEKSSNKFKNGHELFGLMISKIEVPKP